MMAMSHGKVLIAVIAASALVILGVVMSSFSPYRCMLSYEASKVRLRSGMIVSVNTFFGGDADVAHHVRAVGFDPVLVPAVRPLGPAFNYSLGAICAEMQQHHTLARPADAESKALVDGWIAWCTAMLDANHLTLKEISLILSHKYALELIANDASGLDDDIYAIFEEDARLSPAMMRVPDKDEFLRRAFARARGKTGDFFFAYLGTCNPACMEEESFAVNCDSEGHVEVTIAQKCTSYCTHAYAVTKATARDLFRTVYSPTRVASTKLLQIDQMYLSYFDQIRLGDGASGAAGAQVIGLDFNSPVDITGGVHRGIFYQCCRPDPSVGSTLSSPSGFVSFYSAVPVGRVGNLMFEYAALVGLCVKASRFDAAVAKAKRFRAVEECANFAADVRHNDVGLPILNFFAMFGIPFSGRYDVAFRSVEKAAIGANIAKQSVAHRYEEFGYPGSPMPRASVGFDANVMSQPPGTVFTNSYFQSYKYFHPHATPFVQRSFTLKPDAAARGKHFLSSLHEKMETLSRATGYQYELVCLHCRRGDKTDGTKHGNVDNFYSPWALSFDYYVAALDHMKRVYANKKILVALFTGGAKTPAQQEEDRQHVFSHFVSFTDDKTFVFVTDTTEEQPRGLDVPATLQALRECPNMIAASSSFSWWGAFLGDQPSRVVVVPEEIHGKDAPIGYSADDYYPPHWVRLKEPSKQR
jgi:hypothetical protein